MSGDDWLNDDRLNFPLQPCRTGRGRDGCRLSSFLPGEPNSIRCESLRHESFYRRCLAS